MAVVYTTQRCLSVKESYEFILNGLNNKDQTGIELTELITHTSKFPVFETTVTERKTTIQTKYIVEFY